MSYKNYFIYAALSLMAVNCTNEDSIEYGTDSNTDNRHGEITVLKERNPSLPKEVENRPVAVEKREVRENTDNGAMIGNSDALLGYSYVVGNSILGDYENVGSPVISIEKVKEYGEDYITSKNLQKYSAERFSYSDYDRYESHLFESKKVDSGFKLNLGLFKIGRKKTTTSVFKSDVVSEEKVVYGELNLLYQHSSFALQASDGARRFYARECQSSVFMRNLYSSTIGDILNTYGEYVLTGYVTGGKAFALFQGEGKKGSSATLREEGLDKDIDLSFSWKNNSASADCTFGNSSSNGTSTEYETTNLSTKLWTYGGDPEGLGMSSADKLENISFDLSNWVESLSDVKKHTMIDLTESGLYSLSAFVLEENFQKRIEGTSMGIYSKYPRFVTPYIEIVRVFERYASSGQALYDIAPVLVTRQGDRIVLRDGKAATATDEELERNEEDAVFDAKAIEIKGIKEQFYELEIRSNSESRLNPIIGNPLCLDLKTVDEAGMYTYTNPRTGIQYIYDKKNKIAFSHFTDELDGDWILDDYGIRDWVESLPVKSISMATLANSYRIVGL